jgi:hypothetical protein
VISFFVLAAAVVLDHEFDLAAVDAAGGIDAIDIETHRVDRRRISARRRASERGRDADDVILRGRGQRKSGRR